MKLLVTTPMSIIVDATNVRHVRAEDETGSFGILPGHANFVTALTVSVITWRDDLDDLHQVVVRGGVLTVRHGTLVEIATRQAVGEDTFHQLGQAVLQQFRREEQAEEASRVSATRLHLATIRQLQRYLESGRQTAFPGPPVSDHAAKASDLPRGRAD
jgi:F-type H+-transporting ATPase subunit epsilon